MQVRCAQLDKEAGELRIENSTLHEAVQLQRNEAVSSVKVCKLLLGFDPFAGAKVFE